MIPRSARRGSILFGLLVLFIVSILVHRSRYLFGLLLEDGGKDAVFSSVLLSESSEPEKNVTELIPKIIHQTYKTEDIPQHWREGQKAVLDLHPDWEYMFWTDASALSFIETHYPSFLPTYNSYPYPIQRADAFRYFILYHYGGVYLDLDLSPYRSLTPLLQFPAIACLTSPTGISNDMLATVPSHPFYKLVIDNLETYARNWGSGYITVMYSTGPLFLSVLWIQYLRILRGQPGGGQDIDRIKVLVKSAKYGDSYGFFKNVQGGSWHGKDVEMIFWMGNHWLIVTVLGFVGGFLVVGVCWGLVLLVGKLIRREDGEVIWRRGKDRGRGRYRDIPLFER